MPPLLWGSWPPGEDPLDPRTSGSAAKAQSGPYTRYLKTDALKGKRFGVPSASFSEERQSRFRGTPGAVSAAGLAGLLPLRPETRAAFMKAIEGLRAAGATVVLDGLDLAQTMSEIVARMSIHAPTSGKGTENFLAEYGPAQYHSPEEYQKAVGSPLPANIIGGIEADAPKNQPVEIQTVLESDPQADTNYFAPQRRALEAYNETLDRLHLDGLVYPAIQMPPPDETMPQNGQISGGPDSDTNWVNMIGIPAVVVPGGFYADGLPFGMKEISGRDRGETATYWVGPMHMNKPRGTAGPPVLVEKGSVARCQMTCIRFRFC